MLILMAALALTPVPMGKDANQRSPEQAAAEAAQAGAAAQAAAAAAADAAADAAVMPGDAIAASQILASERDGTLYDPTRDAEADVAAAFARARADGRMVMIVLGGNWCHDSRALASHFTAPDFADMLSSRYEVVYVDVGYRDRNLAIPARYALPLNGTPTVMILSAQGELLNRGTAGSWRNAARRRRDTIYGAFAGFGARR